MIAVGIVSFLVWGHDMFVSGMSSDMATVFSVPTLIITIPSAIVELVFAASLYGANIRSTTPMLFCLGFISLFISGGIGGFFLAQPAVDSYLHGPASWTSPWASPLSLRLSLPSNGSRNCGPHDEQDARQSASSARASSASRDSI